MKMTKKLMALATAVMMMTSSVNGSAQEYYPDGYASSRDSADLAPAIALGALALAAIIVISIQNGSGSHSHTH